VSYRPWPPQAVSFALYFFAYYGYVGLFTPYVSLFFADRGMTAAQVGVLMTLMQMSRILGPNLWGWVADHTRSRVNVLRLTAAGSLLSAAALYADDSFAWFFVVMCLLNTFTSSQIPLSEALMLSEMKGDLARYGPLRLWGSVGFIVLVTAGGKLFDWLGIGALPAASALVLLGVLLVGQRLREVPHDHGQREIPPVGPLLRRREVRAFFVSTFLMIAAHAAIYVYFSLYLANLGYNNTVIGFMWSLGVIAEIVFFYFQAPIFQRIPVRTIMLASFGLAVLRFLLIGFGAETLALLLVAQVLHAASFGSHHSACVVTMQRWFSGPLQARGQALYISVSYGLGGTLGGLALSVLWDKSGAQAVYLLAAGFALAGGAAAALSYRWQTLREETP